jgi:predicted TPR repeat methyltransferase
MSIKPASRDALMSSGDPRLDRRYTYAKASLDEGDNVAATDLLEQTVDEAPHWAAAWFLLAQARELSGDVTGALAAFNRTMECDADGVLGADLDIARLQPHTVQHSGNTAYVAALFDEYAPRFDRHLRRDLAYCGPEILFTAVGRVSTLMPRPLTYDHMIDLGCGTGLAAEIFQPRIKWLSGVDLSPRMVALARAKRLYKQLCTGELVQFLQQQPEKSAELVIAADVFVYMGDLASAIAGSARVLERAGLLAFTVQALDEVSHPAADILIGGDKRFSHARSYLERIIIQAGLQLQMLEPAITRMDEGKPVPGYVVVANKP